MIAAATEAALPSSQHCRQLRQAPSGTSHFLRLPQLQTHPGAEHLRQQQSCRSWWQRLLLKRLLCRWARAAHGVHLRRVHHQMCRSASRQAGPGMIVAGRGKPFKLAEFGWAAGQECGVQQLLQTAAERNTNVVPGP